VHRIELAFRCDTSEEVDAVYARRAGHVRCSQKAPWEAFWKQRYAIIEDPDGSRLSLYAYPWVPPLSLGTIHSPAT